MVVGEAQSMSTCKNCSVVEEGKIFRVKPLVRAKTVRFKIRQEFLCWFEDFERTELPPRSLNLGHAARGTVGFPPRGTASAGLLSVAPSFK